MSTKEEQQEEQSKVEQELNEESLETQQASNGDNAVDSLYAKLAENKKAQRKKLIKRSSIAGVILFLIYGIWWAFKPFKAGADYGICRTILELQIPYPQTLYVSQLKKQRDGSMRLWFTYIDGFGEYRMEDFQCKLVKKESYPAITGNMQIEDISMFKGKVSMDPEKLKSINNALVYFNANPVVLNYPQPLPDSINSLQLDFNSVRRFRIDNIKQR